MTHEKGDPIEWYAWSGDVKQILYLHDNAGDEVPHLFSVDLTTGNVRVTIENANAIVATLRKAKRELTYVVYSDEGHGFARPENEFDFYGRVEEFLVKHLGGRAEPWKEIAGAPAELK
jgi:Prolyl oligopeptidase family